MAVVLDPLPHVLPIQVMGSNLICVAKRITAVAGSATYTSGVVSSDGYVRAVAMGIFNENGTIYIDQSNDGSNWDYSSSVATVGGTGFAISAEVVAPYIRFRWANGTANATTTHRLYCHLRSAGA